MSAMSRRIHSPAFSGSGGLIAAMRLRTARGHREDAAFAAECRGFAEGLEKDLKNASPTDPSKP